MDITSLSVDRRFESRVTREKIRKWPRKSSMKGRCFREDFTMMSENNPFPVPLHSAMNAERREKRINEAGFGQPLGKGGLGTVPQPLAIAVAVPTNGTAYF
jgi:hypothetical protein